MAEASDTVILQVGPQGRMVIPASLCCAWKIKTGDILLARIEDDRPPLCSGSKVALPPSTISLAWPTN